MTEIGLTESQATAYLHLLRKGPTAPPAMAKVLKLTRTNAYKVLDQLLELRLVRRAELNKKLVYQAEDPIALASLVSEERNRVIALEKKTGAILKQLRQRYQKSTGGGELATYQGKIAVRNVFERQASLGKPIYFIKSRADTPFMGFETMHYIRYLATKYGNKRYGITQDTPDAPVNPEVDARSNLERTWFESQDYTAPVEWSVSDDELVVVSYDDPPSAIRIKNAEVASAFHQLWMLLDKKLRESPRYKKHPLHAKRKV